MASAKDRKLFKAFTEDAASSTARPIASVGVVASTGDIRKLFKAFHDDPAFHAAVKACNNPVDKHKLIRKAGHVPVAGDQLKAELTKSLQPGASPEDQEFVWHIMHLAAADGVIAVDG
jgi:hypothetical protein